MEPKVLPFSPSDPPDESVLPRLRRTCLYRGQFCRVQVLVVPRRLWIRRTESNKELLAKPPPGVPKPLDPLALFAAKPLAEGFPAASS
jgi:hypothetical protein